MNVRLKAVLVNFGIITGLLFQYWRGSPLLIIVLNGISFLVFANLLMLFAARRSARKYTTD